MAGPIPSILISGIDEKLFETVCEAWSDYSAELSRVDGIFGALKELSNNSFHLICVVLPEDDEERKFAIEQVRVMRGMTLAPIIILVHVPFDQKLAIRALREGADDFSVCPGTLEEATAIGMAMIRRFTQFNTGKKERTYTMLITESIIISLAFRKVFVHGKVVKLMKKEFDILAMLIKSQGRVFTYEQIFRNVWGEDYMDNSKDVLYTQIRRLRSKLQISPDLPEFIRTVAGVGYSYDPKYDNN